MEALFPLRNQHNIVFIVNFFDQAESVILVPIHLLQFLESIIDDLGLAHRVSAAQELHDSRDQPGCDQNR